LGRKGRSISVDTLFSRQIRNIGRRIRRAIASPLFPLRACDIVVAGDSLGMLLMHRSSLCLVFCLCLLSGLSLEALAADLNSPIAYAPPLVARSIISELRGGVFAHAPGTREDGSVDINGEILFSKPFISADPLISFLIPRLHIGATLNTAGDTSQVYAGFTWNYDLTQKIFIEGSVGAAFHNGKTDRFVQPDRLALGCSPLIRGTGSLGYRLSENWTVMATVEHISNGNTCRANQGLTNYGIRVGYVF
jgi:hypothetical protein